LSGIAMPMKVSDSLSQEQRDRVDIMLNGVFPTDRAESFFCQAAQRFFPLLIAKTCITSRMLNLDRYSEEDRTLKGWLSAATEQCCADATGAVVVLSTKDFNKGANVTRKFT
jgi:hypothetical protein